MVNGVLLDGWPIRVHVVIFGWNSRKPLMSNQNDKHGAGGNKLVRDEHDVERSFEVDYEGNISFVEVVSRNQRCSVKDNNVVGQEVLEMAWNCHNNEDGWLSRCVVGILKDFSSISSVNLRLRSKAFTFSSMYLEETLLKRRFDRAAFSMDSSWLENMLWLQAVIPQSDLNSCPNLERQEMADHSLFVNKMKRKWEEVMSVDNMLSMVRRTW
ncbi:hypothetical protein Q3G72_022564 [Acer saccharum]|nr:hypothetical protein Q3G72_022564 [Acer saccharum]